MPRRPGLPLASRRGTAVTFAIALALGPAGCRPTAAPTTPASTPTRTDPGVPYDELRRTHPTRIDPKQPSTGKASMPPTPSGVERIDYTSDGNTLGAWLALPPGASADAPVPGLIYCHGAFALKPADLDAVRPAIERGVAVLLPTWRGENGNPGHLQLLAGEVDDAIAAIETLAARPEVDETRLYIVGHSVGGALAALTSLRPDAKVRLTGSVGGIYVPETFQRWSKMGANRDLVRFDPFDPIEGRLRTLRGNVADMLVPHHAYIGDEDRWFHDNAADVAAAAERAGTDRFVVHAVPGDHATSLRPGLAAFIERLAADAGMDAEPASPAAP